MIAFTILTFLVGGCVGLILGIAQCEHQIRELKQVIRNLRNDLHGARLREQAHVAGLRLTTKQ